MPVFFRRQALVPKGPARAGTGSKVGADRRADPSSAGRREVPKNRHCRGSGSENQGRACSPQRAHFPPDGVARKRESQSRARSSPPRPGWRRSASRIKWARCGDHALPSFWPAAAEGLFICSSCATPSRRTALRGKEKAKVAREAHPPDPAGAGPLRGSSGRAAAITPYLFSARCRDGAFHRPFLRRTNPQSEIHNQKRAGTFAGAGPDWSESFRTQLAESTSIHRKPLSGRPSESLRRKV